MDESGAFSSMQSRPTSKALRRLLIQAARNEQTSCSSHLAAFKQSQARADDLTVTWKTRSGRWPRQLHFLLHYPGYPLLLLPAICTWSMPVNPWSPLLSHVRMWKTVGVKAHLPPGKASSSAGAHRDQTLKWSRRVRLASISLPFMGKC